MAYGDRVSAAATMMLSVRASVATAQAVMATVSLNTISAQNITDINAALAAIPTALTTASAALVKPDSQPF